MDAGVGKTHISSPVSKLQSTLLYILFCENLCSVLQTIFFFVEIQCEIAAKVGMIIQRVVLNSRPGMYFPPVKEQFVSYACLVLQNGEGRNRH